MEMRRIPIRRPSQVLKLLFAAAVTLVASSATATADPAGRQSSQPRATSGEPSQNAEATPPRFRAYPGYAPDPCYRDPDKDAADLCAQWRAAMAAEAAVKEAKRATDWATLSVGFNALGLLGVCLALFLTVQSNRIARTTARQQLRAYITIDNVGFFGISRPNEEQHFTLQMVNCGQTPAVNCHGHIQTFFAERDATIELPTTEFLKGYPSFFIGPQRKSGAVARPFKVSPSERGEYLLGQKNLFIVNTLIYSDIFGAQYRLDQIYRSRGINDGASVDPLLDVSVQLMD